MKKKHPITHEYYQIFTKFFYTFHILCLTETLSVPGQSDDVVSESEENSQKFISTLLESLFILRKIPETAEVITFAVTKFHVFLIMNMCAIDMCIIQSKILYLKI